MTRPNTTHSSFATATATRPCRAQSQAQAQWTTTPPVPNHEIYILPAPIRTFPLPTYYPGNPLSILHIATVWVRHAVFPPPPEPAVVHQAEWHPETGAVHVTDEKSMVALWQQGFFGKGSLSRSEPNWLKRQQVEQGLATGWVSEMKTEKRRQERARMKWERARAEQEAIRQTRLRERLEMEAQMADSQAQPPTGPLELLALPNSDADVVEARPQVEDQLMLGGLPTPPGEEEFFLGSIFDEATQPAATSEQTQTLNGVRKPNLNATPPSESSDDIKPLKRQKSVRFSPKVESTTFELSDPPSPNRSAKVEEQSQGMASSLASAIAARLTFSWPSATSNQQQAPATTPSEVCANKEHLRLTCEEAMFLVFGIGALVVVDPVTKKTIPPRDLLSLFRQNSHFPPRPASEFQPDDNFLIHYAAYHHFRSLGWVPRAGIKFGVDWLLYHRGPVFDHAEFGLILIPAYTHPWWKSNGKEAPRQPWHWLHNVLRVLTHVSKQLVLVYVDVPPPPVFDRALERGIEDAFRLYKVKEVIVKRWSSKRNRG